ncbi:hypothetical protein [Conexibacter sp. SYSU D00693]|uniref:hypothetical protein n=1 Tax=Conexibacter sp. SYSU D00693 TaxID=2812560 RepID=UPI00196B74DD|nr:hypothetical protein [Conexibacter sp. SYSU D00693]
MPAAGEPLGAPDLADVRTHVIASTWDVDRRVRDLALVCRVDAKVVRREERGGAARVRIRARGAPEQLDRFWRRLEEAAPASTWEEPGRVATRLRDAGLGWLVDWWST